MSKFWNVSRKFTFGRQMVMQKLQKLIFFNYCETIAKLLRNYLADSVTISVRKTSPPPTIALPDRGFERGRRGPRIEV